MPTLTLTEPSMWLITLLAATVAGFIRGFTGFGGPAIIILVLVQFYAPVSVLTKAAVIDMVANIKLLPSTSREVNWRLTIWLIVASIAGVPIGLFLVLHVDPAVMKRVIALVAAACAAIMLLGWRLSKVPPIWLHAVVGFISGVALGATYIALTMIVFLFATPASSAQSRANTIWWVFIVGLTIIAGYMWAGMLTWSDIWRSCLIGGGYLLAAMVGSHAFRAASDRNFRRVVLWLLLGLSTMALVGQ